MAFSKELIQKELAFRELARRHFIFYVRKIFTGFQENWHHNLIADKLEQVEQGKIKRLIISMPPRFGKSKLASELFPTWYLGRHPEEEIVVASYAAELAASFGRNARNLVLSKPYSALFPATTLAEDSQAVQNWHTQQNGGYYSVGVGGALTGKGAKILLIDDPVKNREEAESEQTREKIYDWFRSTAYTRLTPDGAIVLVQTRWHDEDLAGRVQHDNTEKWETITFKAIAEEDEKYRKKGVSLWPKRFTKDRLMEIKKVIGPYEWSALYQQEPLDEGSQEFRRQMFKKISWHNVTKLKTTKYLTIDTAISQKASADKTGFVINFVTEDNFWHLKAWGERLTPHVLIDKLFDLHKKYNFQSIGIEKTMYLMTFKPFLDAEMRKRNTFLPIKELSHNQTQKELRVRALLPRYESGSVFHIEGECNDLEEELLRFPKGAHDDVADAAAYMNQIAEVTGAGKILSATDSNVFAGIREAPVIGEDQPIKKFVYAEADFDLELD